MIFAGLLLFIPLSLALAFWFHVSPIWIFITGAAERGLFAGKTNNPGALDENLRICVSVVLILVYFSNLIYTLITHRDVFSARKEPKDEQGPG